MMKSTDPRLFEDMFEVLAQDKDGRKFDNVSRYECHSDLFEFDLVIDINTQIYPLQVGDKFTLVLANTLYQDNTPEPTDYAGAFPLFGSKSSLMDNFEYVMHGKVFKYKDDSQNGQLKVEVYISFGGLLMQLKGDPQKLNVIEVDSNIYLLMRKL